MNRIEEQARYYRNIPLRNRSIKAVVHLEDAEDMLFWNLQLQNAFPATYHFITFSKNEKGNDVRGCEQCLRYKPYLSKKTDVLDKSIHTDGYLEIDNVQADLRKITSKE